MNGSIKGDFYMKELPNQNFAIAGNTKLYDVNVKRLFNSFNNFEQSIITVDNLEGIVTSDISFQTEWTNNFDFLDKAFFAEATTTMQNGKLIDFKPAEKLSTFVDLEELKTISFSTLHNDFVIKDRTFYIPKMAINSSAFNITVEGKQHFDGEFDYRLQLVLNEFLSKKRKNKNEEYFGEIEDDGLGKTRLFLKIIGDQNDTKVSYDKSEAKVVIKEKLQNEKREILKILKSEFSRKKDTSESNLNSIIKPDEDVPEQTDEFNFNFDD